MLAKPLRSMLPLDPAGRRDLADRLALTAYGARSTPMPQIRPARRDKPPSQSSCSTDIVASWQGSQSEMKWARGHAACRRDLDIAQMSSDKHPVHPRKLSGHQKLVRHVLLCTPPPRPCTIWCQVGRLQRPCGARCDNWHPHGGRIDAPDHPRRHPSRAGHPGRRGGRRYAKDS